MGRGKPTVPSLDSLVIFSIFDRAHSFTVSVARGLLCSFKQNTLQLIVLTVCFLVQTSGNIRVAMQKSLILLASTLMMSVAE